MMTVLFIILFALGVGIAAWFLSSDGILYGLPKEKRKNDEKYKNDEFIWRPSMTYEELLNAHELEREMLAWQHQNELIQLEYKQKEQLTAWIDYHATPSFVIEPNNDYRKGYQ